MAYDTSVIRELLTAAFGDEELGILCYDYFHPVYEGFAADMSKTRKVQVLIEYCSRNDQFSALLNLVQKTNPVRYAEFEGRLSTRHQPPIAPPLSSSPIQDRDWHHPRTGVQSRNPFRYLRPVPPDEFLGRWALVREIAWNLALPGGDSCACIGGRRFGKSSLLCALHHYLPKSQAQQEHCAVLPLLLDFKRYNFKSETNFFATLLQEVCRRVDVDSRCLPRDPCPIRVSLDQHKLHRLLAGDPPGLTLSRFEEALDHILNRLSQAGGPIRIAILLDEVDDVLRYPWYKVLFGQLRSLVCSGDLAENVRLAMAGSHSFVDEVSNRGSPLWNVLKLHYLTTFDEATTFKLMERVPSLEEVAQRAVWEQSGGHPFLAQYLLYHLWEAGINEVDEEMVSQVTSRFLHEEQLHLEGWAQAVDVTGLQIYSQLVDQPGWVDETELIKAVSSQKAFIKRALVNLCYHGFIIHDEGWKRYRYIGELLRKWYAQEGKYLVESKLAGPNMRD